MGGYAAVTTKSKLVLVLGGARSGKSEFAEKYVLHAGIHPCHVYMVLEIRLIFIAM